MPVLLTQGDADTVAPPQYARRWAAAMKDLNMNCQCLEVPGQDHGTIIGMTMPDIFRFFGEPSNTAMHWRRHCSGFNTRFASIGTPVDLVTSPRTWSAKFGTVVWYGGRSDLL